MVMAFLDWQRATLLCKLDGLSDEELRRPHDPSGLTLLGIVKHLQGVEAAWFREDFAGEDPHSVTDPLPSASNWTIGPDETTQEVLDGYQREVERSRALTKAADLDDPAKHPGNAPGLTLRWILVHMIEETARHNGHADLIREAIDGQTGH
jgi:uncharacterized damage-inducible protein DinB